MPTTQANLVHETSITTGTGNLTTTAVNGKQRFSDAGAFGTGATLNVFDYFISNRDAAEWERGTGHMSAVGTLVRDTPIEGSAGAATLVTFSAGTKDITNDIPAVEQFRGPCVPSGRLTLTTGVPVTASDVTGATTIYLTAAGGGQFTPVFDGTNWRKVDISSDLSLALDATAAHTGYQQSGKNFDVWSAYVSGATYFGTGPSWNSGTAGSDTARGTGAGSTELATLNGVLVNKNSMTLRFGSAVGNTVTVPANQATLLGTIRMTADGTTEDSFVKRFVSNLYNIAPREMLRVEATGSWSYSTASWQQANASASNQIEWVHCAAGRSVVADVLGYVLNSTATARNVAVGIGVDSTTVNSAQRPLKCTVANTAVLCPQAFYNAYPGLGYHKATWLEQGSGADVQTWFGNNGGTINSTPPIQSGIAGRTPN